MYKKILILFSIMTISALALSGCATTRNVEGKPIMSSSVNKIINGVTTKKQILQMYGPPLSIKRNILKFGVETYKYRFRYKKYMHLGNEILTSATRKLTEKLNITFRHNIVIAHSFTTQGNISLKKILKNKNKSNTQ
jgi:outer membrane protein assembly factor BamE (lipoprotein component of BamABCDE complex)